jgi:hypothetical protein
MNVAQLGELDGSVCWPSQANLLATTSYSKRNLKQNTYDYAELGEAIIALES